MIAACCGVLLAANTTIAGGGPENVLLLINANSDGSKTIANNYAALRNIPASNVVYIDWRGSLEDCQGQNFWNVILKPAIDKVHERHLEAQIDYVVFSTDFPWRVQLKPLFPDEQFQQPFPAVGSATGVTFLWHYVHEKNPAIVLPIINWYLSSGEGKNDAKCEKLGKVESRGFSSNYIWNQQGKKIQDPTKGQTYLLSTMLGVTQGRGNTVDEILSYLKRSVAADGTRPRGTIYFMKNNDVRSTTRDMCYDGAVEELLRLGVPARVDKGKLPQGARDVLGIMTGAADVDFAGSGSKFLPGAICDNLTSLGGVLTLRMGQTPLSEFLRHGASGATGTVTEPMALQVKFALPSLFIHYARGCSLAESYFQSVACPYQLLIVGDPLCQPWAVVPTVTVDGLKAGDELKGQLTVRANATTPAPRTIGTMELFVDGRLVARFPPKEEITLDTTKLPDGYHELRFVAVQADSIESRGRLIVPVRINNHGASVELTVSPSNNVSATDKVRISAKQPGAKSIVVRQYCREVARFDGEAGDVEVLAATFGRGPVTLQAESTGPQPAVSPAVRLEVQ